VKPCIQSSSVRGACEKCGRRPAVLHMPTKKRGWYCEACCPVCSPAKKQVGKGARDADFGGRNDFRLWTQNDGRYTLPGLMDKDRNPAEANAERAGLITDVENRLQFNTFVSIFFCTLLFSYFRSQDKPDVEANKILVHWALVPAFYLMSYVIFESGKGLLSRVWLKTTNILLLICSGLFVMPMAVTAAVEAKWYRAELLLTILSFRGIFIAAILLPVPMYLGIGVGIEERLSGWMRSRRKASVEITA
jgi:hypothetical protein